MSKAAVRTAAFCLFVLGAGLLIYRVLVATAPEPERTDVATALRRVAVLRPEPVAVRRQWHGFGTAQAMDSANVPARVTATVIDVPDAILPGTAVRTGQLLCLIDGADFDQQVEIATQRLARIEAELNQIELDRQSLDQQLRLRREQLDISQREFQRLKSLNASGAANQSDLDRTRTTAIVAERAIVDTMASLRSLGPGRHGLEAQRTEAASFLALARLDLARCRITSPIDGVLERVDIEVGEYLRVGDRVARVVSLKRMEVPVQLAASSRPHVAAGDQVQLAPASGSGLTWEGRISRIGPTDDHTTRTLTVYVELEQDPAAVPLLVPGLFVEATVVAATPSLRWVLPRRAVRSSCVLLVDDGLVMTSAVTVEFFVERTYEQFGLADTQWAVLADPLREGILVVLNPTETIRDGQAVEVILPTTVRSSSREPAP